MNSLRQLLAPAVLAIILATAALPAARANDDPMSFVPSDSGAVISVNARRLFDSDAFQQLFEERADKQARSGLNFVKALIGVDLLKDIDRALLFAENPEDGDRTGAILLQGRFDQERLLGLVKANVDYKEESLGGGVVLFSWEDAEDNSTKYASFLAPNTLIVSGARGVIEKSLAAWKEKSNSFAASAAGKMLPRDADKAIAWIAITEARDADLEKLGVEGGAAALSLEGDDLVAWVSLNLTEEANPDDFRDVFEGIAALARIQHESEELAGMGHRAQVRSQGRSVEMSVSLPIDQILEAID